MEAATTVKIQMTIGYGDFRRGTVLPDVPDGQANEWIRRGIAIPVIETAAIEQRGETADATPKRRGRRAVPQPHQDDASEG